MIVDLVGVVSLCRTVVTVYSCIEQVCNLLQKLYGRSTRSVQMCNEKTFGSKIKGIPIRARVSWQRYV